MAGLDGILRGGERPGWTGVFGSPEGWTGRGSSDHRKVRVEGALRSIVDRVTRNPSGNP